MIIKSLLDNDAYTFTMMQVAFHRFLSTRVKYAFKCRNAAIWTTQFLIELNAELDAFCKLTFTDQELIDLKKKMPYLKDDFIEFLRLYKLNRKHINASIIDGELKISVEGPWYLTVIFEVPVLAIVNELYFRNKQGISLYANGMVRLEAKLQFHDHSECFPFCELGTRRRFSFEWQDSVIRLLVETRGFAGTSNVYFAIKYNLKAIGTMSHQYIMAGAGQLDVRLSHSQAYMLQHWADEYRGELGIALTDTYGMNAFLNDFDLYFAKLFDGMRHDSGDPFVWGLKAISHYKKLGIDHRNKTFVFSNSLTIYKSSKIWDEFKDSARILFGIGTDLTNDFEGIIPLQIVMKIVTCNDNPVAKVSDCEGKGMCEDPEYENYVKSVFKINK